MSLSKPSIRPGKDWRGVGRRRAGQFSLALLGGVLLAACAALIGPRQLDVPLARLQQGLERRFPLENRLLEVFEIELSRPRLTLLPERGRVMLALDANVAPPFIKQSWSGRLAFSGRLFADPARGAIFIGDTKIDQVAIDGVDEARQRLFTRLANLVSDKIVRDLPLYSFRPEDLRMAGVQFVPERIETTADALRITFVPVR